MELRYPLSGADNFQILLDRHMRKRSRVGNVVRLSLELDPSADLQALAAGIAVNRNFQLAVSLRMKRATLVMPRWESRSGVDAVENVDVHERCTSDYFNVMVLHRDLPLTRKSGARGPVAFRQWQQATCDLGASCAL